MLKKLQKLMMLCLALLGISMNASAIDLESTFSFASSPLTFDDGSTVNFRTSNTSVSNIDGKVFNGITFHAEHGAATNAPQFWYMTTSKAYYLNVLLNSTLGFEAPKGYYFDKIVFNYRTSGTAGITPGVTPDITTLGLDYGTYTMSNSNTTGTWENTDDTNPTSINTVCAKLRNITSIQFTLVKSGDDSGDDNPGNTPTTYTVTVANDIANGTVTADKTEGLEEGDEVTLTATPATGYEFGAWAVTDGSNSITVTNNKFNMPAANVTVSATFNKVAPTDYPGKGGVYSSKVNEYVLEIGSTTMGIEVPTSASESSTAKNNIDGKSFQGIKFAGEIGDQGTKNYPCLRYYTKYQIQMTKGNVVTMTAPDNCWIKSVAFEYYGTAKVTDIDEYGVGSMNGDKTVWTAADGKTPTEVKFTTATTTTVRITKITFTIIGENGEEEEVKIKEPQSFDITNMTNYDVAPGKTNKLTRTFFAEVPSGVQFVVGSENSIKLMTPTGNSMTCTSVNVNDTELQVQFGGLDEGNLQNGRYTITIPAEVLRYEDEDYIYTNNEFTASWDFVKTITVSINKKLGMGTFYSDFATTLPANTQAYTGVLNDNRLTLTEIEGNIIPAETAVIITGTAGEFATSQSGIKFNGENDLMGVSSTTNVSDIPLNGGTLCVLGYENEQAGFYHYTGSTLAANKAFLVVPAAQQGRINIVFNDETTAINAISNNESVKQNIYNLNGQRVNANAKGIVIINGKKIVK